MAMNIEELTLEAKNQFSRLQSFFRHFSFSKKKQLAYLEDLYLLINDGIPANRAVEMMAQVTVGITREVSISLTEKISQGQPLADGMQEWFSPNVVEIVRVGEAGGALAQTMKSAINSLSASGVAMGSFVGAVTYPLLVVVMACGIIVFLNNSVFSEFKMIKPVEEWPDAGKQLLSVAYVVTTWWWAVIVGFIAVMIAMKVVLANYVGELRPLLDNYPPFSLYRKMVAARVLETLGLLVANGVVFKSALKVMTFQANPYMAWHLNRMEALLSKGKSNIADVLDTGLVEHSNLMRLRIMAEVKGFEHGLVRMGVRGTTEATATMKVIAKILGGVLMAVGGLLIIVIIRGIFLTGMSMAA